MNLWNWIFRRKATYPPPSLADWRIVTAELNEGCDLVMRLRVVKPRDPQIKKFSTSVGVKWKYTPYNENGMPPNAEIEKMNEFEDAAADLCDENGNSYLVAVATGNGLREWHFYGRDFERFVSHLNRMLASCPPFPIEIEHSHDPEWKTWQFFMRMTERAKNA